MSIAYKTIVERLTAVRGVHNGDAMDALLREVATWSWSGGFAHRIEFDAMLVSTIVNDQCSLLRAILESRRREGPIVWSLLPGAKELSTHQIIKNPQLRALIENRADCLRELAAFGAFEAMGSSALDHANGALTAWEVLPNIEPSNRVAMAQELMTICPLQWGKRRQIETEEKLWGPPENETFRLQTQNQAPALPPACVLGTVFVNAAMLDADSLQGMAKVLGWPQTPIEAQNAIQSVRSAIEERRQQDIFGEEDPAVEAQLGSFLAQKEREVLSTALPSSCASSHKGPTPNDAPNLVVDEELSRDSTTRRTLRL